MSSAITTLPLFPNLPVHLQLLIWTHALTTSSPFLNPHHQHWWDLPQWSRLIPYHSGPRERRRFHLGSSGCHVRDMMTIMHSCRLARLCGFKVWLRGLESLPVEAYCPATEGRKERVGRLLDEMVGDVEDRLDDATYTVSKAAKYQVTGPVAIMEIAASHDPDAANAVEEEQYPKALSPKALY